MKKMSAWASALVLVVSAARADVKPNVLFQNGAVLQRDMAVPVWGTAREGEKVTVTLEGNGRPETVSTTGAGGKFMVKLKSHKAGGQYTLTVKGDNEVVVRDVTFGDVWICSGQSNMQWSIMQSGNPEKALAEADDPTMATRLKLFTVTRRGVDAPESDLTPAPARNENTWVGCTRATLGNFSAVAYYFGRDLNQALNVPIGIISTNVGGTPAEAWTSRPVLTAQFPELIKGYDTAVANYPNALKAHEEAAAKAKAENKPAPRAPGNPSASMQRPCGLYNAMITPLAPYAIKGAIWYQGESNAGRAYQYRTLFPAMIKNWRDLWGQGDFAFLFVQLAPFMAIVNEPHESAWAELREAQLLTLKASPKTGMAVITDVGDPVDIHPKAKEPVGARLALAARAIAHGERIVYSGPVYKSMAVTGDKAVLTFDHVGGGLAADGELKGFAIAGEDQKFVNAQAKLDGNKVVVWAASVSKPVAVRFGWANCPVVNLANKEGLPATPFRTDDFAMLTKPK